MQPCLFDLDGTLVDSLTDIWHSANATRAAFGLPAVERATAQGWVGDGLWMLLRRALADVGPFEAVRERAWQVYEAHHREQCVRTVKPYPGVAEHLARWHQQGRPMAVVTNKSTAFAERVLEHVGLRRWLPVLVCGDTLPQRKPDPEPLREALRRLGVVEVRGAMIGDGVQDLRAGKAAGLRTVAVLYGYTDEATLREEGADAYWCAFGGEPGGR